VSRPTVDSPIIAAVVADFLFFGFQVTQDVDGQSRPMIKDVGADQVNGTGSIQNRPLTRSMSGRSSDPRG
jgi:hypothetical protein